MTAPNPPLLQRTPLFEQIQAQGARMTEFAGWEMPVQFAGVLQEHQAVRQQAGMFDISHMGKFHLRGGNLIGQLQGLVPSDLSRLLPGQAQYTVLLNPQAGIMDDLIVYYQGENHLGEQQCLLIVNAATTAKDHAWFMAHLDQSQVVLEDVSVHTALIAVQGPQATTLLQTLVKEDLTHLPAFAHVTGTILGQRGFLARTGYTGEDGFEVMVDPQIAAQLWQALLAAGVTPCGLGARDTLRLEAAMALYGQDINGTTTPLEAGLGWLVHLSTKGDFIGRSILEQQKQGGVQRQLVGLQMQGRNIARHDYPVLAAGTVVGTVTSGTLSPTLGYPIALAYVPSTLAQPGRVLEIAIRGKPYPATVVKRPFYRRP
ncbi:glycine cleavage system protein T [Neosynechococcus sphagnicola sy1]|uniref:Aminomethyltransferase n=1 Tax=Neosynechococcus sphagnicola sy1 TaxID=1497020 RepID=A0A098TM16_9CYAN|nr:glycine cleavage system aminomethyltransferase GcvT [Neosynechococcus sphagnicola]KGF73306.1 glycine cleavage system protein T [Neosynechococcus sphagnicola sy1]